MNIVNKQKVKIISIGGYFPTKPITAMLFTYDDGYQIFNGNGFEVIMSDYIVYDLIKD